MTQFIKFPLTIEAAVRSDIARDRVVKCIGLEIPSEPAVLIQAYLPPPPNPREMIEARAFWDFTPDCTWEKLFRLNIKEMAESYGRHR